MDNAVAALTAARLLLWPVSALLTAVRLILSPALRLAIFLVSPIWLLASFLALPLVHLIRGLYHIVTFPLQLQWLQRIETLYIYLGIAALVGSMAGAVLYFIFNFLSSSLIDTQKTSLQRPPRTTADFRAAQHAKHHVLAPSPLIGKATARRARGLLSQVIVEEDDSDF